LIREYARLVGIEYLEACDELFPALAHHRLTGAAAVPPQPPVASHARRVLTAYYSDESLTLGGLAPFDVEINGRPLRLALATRPHWIDLSIPLGLVGASSPQERCTLTSAPGSPIDARPFRTPALSNWEVGNLIRCSTRPGIHTGPKRGLAALITSTEGWTSEGLLVLIEGLARLKQLFPERVCLPSLEIRRLAPAAAELL
jgi:hypothetical protein